MTNGSFVAGGTRCLQRASVVEFSNTGRADPLQLIALALDDAQAAKERFPNYRLTRLVGTRLELYDADMAQLADLVGDDVLRQVSATPRSFNDHLRHVIGRYRLELLFRHDGHAPHHHAVRPTGYDFHRDEVVPTEMEQWRADYRAMPDERQMLAASIIWLYRAGTDKIWLRRVPCTWHAADAITCMKEKDIFHDWARLFALYPGW